MNKQFKEPTISLLQQLRQKQQLAHFYHISLAQLANEQEATDWQQQLLQSLLQEENISSSLEQVLQNGHPDLLQIAPKNSSHYVQDDFLEFFKVLSYRPLNWRYRYIFIQDAHLLASSNLSHKLLKSLEEPPQGNIIFFINPTAAELLPTIESRAIFLRPNYLQQAPGQMAGANWQEVLRPFADQAPHEILESLRSGKNKAGPNAQQFCRAVLKACLEKSTLDAKVVDKLLDTINLFEKAQAYKNPESERLLTFVELFKNLPQNA